MADGKLNPAMDGTNYMIKDYVPGTDVTLQKDFVYGYAEGNKGNEESGLALTMRHGLTQISLKAKNTNEGYRYKITGVRVGNFIGSGDFRFPTNLSTFGDWMTAGKTKETYEVDYSGSSITLTPEVQDIMGAAGNVIVVPQALTAWNPTSPNDGSYLAVKVKITTKAGADVFDGWAATPIATAAGTPLEQGMIYSYILDFSEGAGYSYPDGTEILGGPIKFTIECWSETKGTLTEESTMENFGLYGFLFASPWDTHNVPYFISNEEVIKTSGWATNYRYPNDGRYLRFYAYSPYNCTGATFPGTETSGAILIRYTDQDRHDQIDSDQGGYIIQAFLSTERPLLTNQAGPSQGQEGIL